jgi:hypothetical protein
MNELPKAGPDELRTHRVRCSRRLTMNIYPDCTSVLPFVKRHSVSLSHPPSQQTP